MVGPLGLVHPPEEYVHDLHQSLFLQGELLLDLVVTLAHIVYHIDDIVGFLLSPELVPFALVNEVLQLVEETVYHFSLVIVQKYDLVQKRGHHVLAGPAAL